jgi:hypothetical protein
MIPSMISISRPGSFAGLCFVFPVLVQLVRTSFFSAQALDSPVLVLLAVKSRARSCPIVVLCGFL